MNQQISAFEGDSWQQTAFEEAEVTATEETSKPALSAEVLPEEKTIPKAVETSAKPAPKTETPQFAMQMPCEGEVIAPCSVDELVFCESMDDWRTHNGLDIAGALGDQVRAAEAGTVSQVYKDELLGVVVVVDHGNQISSLYGNLQSEDFINVGTKVEKGDVIGGIGEAGVLEANLEPHLHFEVMTNGEYKNPAEMIKN